MPAWKYSWRGKGSTVGLAGMLLASSTNLFAAPDGGGAPPMDSDFEDADSESGGENGQEVFVCRNCKRSFKTERGLQIHERSCQESYDKSSDDYNQQSIFG